MPDNDLETRVASLEHEVVRLREDAASARALAALADRESPSSAPNCGAITTC